MKITSISPLIVSRDANKLIALFDELGFEKKHQQSPAEGITDTTMKDADGHRLDVAKVDSDQARLMIRMNVDNFDEVFEFLKGKGFTNPSGRIIETDSAKSACVVSPSGFAFDLCEHKK